MKQKKKKVFHVHDVSTIKTVETVKIEQKLEEHNGFKIGEIVWFNTSLVREKYSCGTIKEIILQKNGMVAICVWDDMKKMSRAFYVDKLFRKKPIKKRKPRTNKSI